MIGHRIDDRAVGRRLHRLPPAQRADRRAGKPDTPENTAAGQGFAANRTGIGCDHRTGDGGGSGSHSQEQRRASGDHRLFPPAGAASAERIAASATGAITA